MNIPTNIPNYNAIQIIERDGTLRVSSREVAANFGRLHRDVLKAIRNLECSADFGMRNFAQTPYVDPQNGQTYQMYEMTRDGFTFLVMGFTGKNAAEWKEKYISAFNAMEVALRKAAVPAETIEQIERSFGIMRMLAAKVTGIETAIGGLAASAAGQGYYVQGKTSGEVWAQYNLPKLKSGSLWLGNRLAEMGCQLDDCRSARLGLNSARMFDPDKAEACMKNGLLHKARLYCSERMGQDKLALIGGGA